MQFNPDQAQRAGQQGIQTGPVTGILTAKKIIARTGGHGIEFTLEADNGAKANYLNLYYLAGSGKDNATSVNIIQAMMGLLRLQNVNLENLPDGAPIPELSGKPMGLVLQKTLYTKGDNSDGYKFEIHLPFNAQTGQTFKEITEQKPATAVAAYCETLEDKDERVTYEPTQAQREAVQQGGWGAGAHQPQYGPTDFEDEIF